MKDAQWSYTVRDLARMEPDEMQRAVDVARGHAQSPPEADMCDMAVWYLWAFSHQFPPAVEIGGQVQVGRYRLDLAIIGPQGKLDIECDGVTYHGDRDAFERDRKRDRDVASMGWTPIRYAASELTRKSDDDIGPTNAVLGEIHRRLTAKVA